MTFEEIVLADQHEFQNETCCVIEEQQDWNGFAIMTYKEIKRTDTRNPVLYTGSYDECKSFISRSIAAQELVDSANREHEEETYTREEVYLVANRSVHAMINNLLTDNRTRTIKQVINSEIDTVKIF